MSNSDRTSWKEKLRLSGGRISVHDPLIELITYWRKSSLHSTAALVYRHDEHNKWILSYRQNISVLGFGSKDFKIHDLDKIQYKLYDHFAQIATHIFLKMYSSGDFSKLKNAALVYSVPLNLPFEQPLMADFWTAFITEKDIRDFLLRETSKRVMNRSENEIMLKAQLPKLTTIITKKSHTHYYGHLLPFEVRIINKDSDVGNKEAGFSRENSELKNQLKNQIKEHCIAHGMTEKKLRVWKLRFDGYSVDDVTEELNERPSTIQQRYYKDLVNFIERLSGESHPANHVLLFLNEMGLFH